MKKNHSKLKLVSPLVSRTRHKSYKKGTPVLENNRADPEIKSVTKLSKILFCFDKAQSLTRH